MFDIVVRHKGPIPAATDVAPIVRLWIERETARPKRARFFGGEIDLEVHWVLLDKSGPLADKVFELPENLGRELDIDSDEDMKTLLTLQMGKAFPDPGEPKNASHFWGSLQFLASGIVYGEIADECDLADGTQRSGESRGSEDSIGYDNSGISIEILQGEPWRNVKITINADFGPEAYSLYLNEIPVGKRMTLPFSEFKNQAGHKYLPRNYRHGRTIIRVGDEIREGFSWETAL